MEVGRHGAGGRTKICRQKIGRRLGGRQFAGDRASGDGGREGERGGGRARREEGLENVEMQVSVHPSNFIFFNVIKRKF